MVKDDELKQKVVARLEGKEFEEQCSDCGEDLNKYEKDYGEGLCCPCMKGNQD